MEDWFLEIWGEQLPARILRFYEVADAWKYVVDNNVARYCLYKGTCILDMTSFAKQGETEEVEKGKTEEGGPIGNLILRVEILAGTNIEVAVDGMIALRRHLGVNVIADFNGTRLFACSDDQTVGGLVKEYNRDVRRRGLVVSHYKHEEEIK